MDSTQVNWVEIAQQLITDGKQVAISAIDTIKEFAPYAWELAHRQVMVEAWLSLIFVVISIIGCASVFIFGAGRQRKDGFISGNGNPNVTNLCFILGGAFSAITVIVGLCISYDSLLVFLNPDWYTIERIVELSKGVF